jgi:PAS domain S-box-containing protein
MGKWRLSMIKKNKFITFAFLSLMVLFVILYFVIDANKTKSKLFFSHADQINTLVTLDSEFNNFIDKRSYFTEFDLLNRKTAFFLETIDSLIEESSNTNLSPLYKEELLTIKKEFLEKELWIERLKSRKAFEFNIMAFIFDTQSDEFLSLDTQTKEKINLIRVEVIKDIYIGKIDIEMLVTRFAISDEMVAQEPFLGNFINQLKALERSVAFQTENYENAINKKLDNSLQKAKVELQKEKELTQTVYWIVFNFLFSSIAIFISTLIYFYNKLSKTQKQLSAFKTAVENSDNVIVLTDKNKKIVFANEAFSKITGYNVKDAIGRNPSMLKSGLQDNLFYKELNETIALGQTWRGRFINKDKKGGVFYENASITPIFEDGEIAGYLAIKLDVTEAILHTKELERLNNELENRVAIELQKVREMDKILIQQSKMASMGDMMANIAHQWRQPLSAISTIASGLIVQKQFGILDINELEQDMEKIVKNSEYLSKTIDNFRNFFNPNKPKELKGMRVVFSEIDDIMHSTLQKNHITVVKNIEDFELHTHINELKQVLINLFKNASDAIGENGFIFVDAFLDKQNIHIKIKDSGGGIPEDIIDKIYEPYFTTKHQSIGTGIGLNMTYQIITEHLKGSIVASNEDYEYNKEHLRGAVFHITIQDVK